MRILFLTSELPYPPHSGGAIKTISILDYLKRSHEVDVICFRRAPLTREQEEWARENSVVTLPLNRGRDIFTLASSYLGRRPLSIERNRSAEMARSVRSRVDDGGYEAVFVDGWLMAQYLPPGFPGLKLLHEHNAEHLLWERQAKVESNLLLRSLIRLEARRVRRYESQLLRRFDAVFAVSAPDRDALSALGLEPQKLKLLPNLPDPTLLEQPELDFGRCGPVVLYLGTLSWIPNVEGVKRFLRHVWPLVTEAVPEARFLIAGRGAADRLEWFARNTPAVDFVGPVDDPERLYSSARVFVEATRSGGGTKLKVLNALARGLPVVASPLGAEGLAVVDGDHLLIRDDDAAFAQAVIALLSDKALWSRLSRAGRSLVRERYVAEVAYRVLDEVLARSHSAAGSQRDA
jgi:glycosyltransferase involved in cell wall biosynthesis